ncbi:MAG TPA: hypothetical protein PKV50_07100 [Prolixibacteraceae bacterium]|nr:hypothetical protein [Bacteroidales bacterium]HUM89279.1 hypothetical protein [Prolixibacteraceae bacterium]
MKNLILLLPVFILCMACSNENDWFAPAELDNPTGMAVFCQTSIQDTLKFVEYGYDGNKLITEKSIQQGEVQSITTYEYNAEDLLVSEILETDWDATKKTYVYNDNNQLINILYRFINYDSTRQISRESNSEAPLEYQNNRLVKQWEYWGGFSTYEYKGDNVVKRIDYTKLGEKHHITTFSYSGNLLIQEKKETNAGSLLYLKTYKYDSHNRLVQILDGENIIEENHYIDNQLIEKRTYYFGIDPGFDFCRGNYIYKYTF